MEDFSSHVGQILLAISQNDRGKAQKLLDDLYKSTATELTPNAITSLQNCHDTLLRLQAVEDLRIVSSWSPSDETSLYSNNLEQRLHLLGSNVQDKQYLLGIRRAVIHLRSIPKDPELASGLAHVCETCTESSRSESSF